jgi:hypothetical protein
MLKEHRTGAKPLLWTGFNQLLDMRVVKGRFPDCLIEAWKSYSIVKETENSLPGSRVHRIYHESHSYHL